MAKKSKTTARKRGAAKDLLAGDARHVKGFADVKGGRKAGKGQQEYLIVKMSDIIVTSVSPSGSSGDSGLVSP